MTKLRTRPVVFRPSPFLDLFARSHWPSIMVSTVSNDDVVIHKTYCFDLDLSLMLRKVTNNLDSFFLFTRDARLNAGGFDSDGVAL